MSRRSMRDMRRRLRDMRMNRRDGRNPYGSRGGYVTSGRDRAGRRDYRYDMGFNGEYDGTEYPYRYGNDYNTEYDYSDYNMGYQPNREYDRHYEYMPSYMSDYGYGRDYNRDYARRRSSTTGRYMRDRAFEEENYLSDDELMEWSKELLEDVEEKDKMYFTKENIERKAKEMGIKFDKFSFGEFYTTALMMYTDYGKTLGSANMDIYLRLAKDWLCDEDAEMQYGEKLSAYYDNIVEGM